MTDSVQSAFIAEDGETVAIIDWPLPDRKPRGVVVLVHGLGEHIWRYKHVAAQLNEWGFVVRGFDHVGHGDSGGDRGSLPHKNRMLKDLADVIDDSTRQYGSKVPVIVIGHSMGGLVAADLVRRDLRHVSGLVLSSPALNAGIGFFQKLLIGLLLKVAPDLRVDNGLKAQYVSRDPAVVKAYIADKLVHRKISARLANYIASTGPKVIAAAHTWTVPTLVLYAGKDRLVNPLGSSEFVRAAPRSLVRAKCFEQMYHEIFNDPEQEHVFSALKTWLDTQFPVKALHTQ